MALKPGADVTRSPKQGTSSSQNSRWLPLVIWVNCNWLWVLWFVWVSLLVQKILKDILEILFALSFLKSVTSIFVVSIYREQTVHRGNSFFECTLTKGVLNFQRLTNICIHIQIHEMRWDQSYLVSLKKVLCHLPCKAWVSTCNKCFLSQNSIFTTTPEIANI